jgi:hypothetical protein
LISRGNRFRVAQDLLPLAGRANKDWFVLARGILAFAVAMWTEKIDLHEKSTKAYP